MIQELTLSVIVAACAVAGLTGTVQAQETQAQPPPSAVPVPVTLKVGDPAPPLVVEKWIKGQPLNLKDGKVNVVEFWATWCGPCKAGMPHVSDLAKKYAGKASIAGISIWERLPGDQIMPAVESFVQHANDSMAYAVGAAGKADVMGTTWARAAGQNGIPVAFVIDRQGRIAWIGHPGMGLDEAIGMAFDDKLDAAGHAQLTALLDKRRQTVGPMRAEFLRARGADDFASMVALSDSIVALVPYMTGMVTTSKYVALTHLSPTQAAMYGEQLLAERGNAPIALGSVGRAIMNDSKIAGERDYALALRMLERTEQLVELSTEQRMMLAKARELAAK